MENFTLPPKEVLAQLDASGGRIGMWLPHRYGQAQLNGWRSWWLENTAIGREAARKQRHQVATAALQAKLQAEREEARLQAIQEAEEARRGEPIEPGTWATIQDPASAIGGRLVRVEQCRLWGSPPVWTAWVVLHQSEAEIEARGFSSTEGMSLAFKAKFLHPAPPPEREPEFLSAPAESPTSSAGGAEQEA